MIQKLYKPPKLKPLALGDIMVALINQQHSIDHTQQYKQLLGQRWVHIESSSQPQQQQLILPQFAENQYTYQQILDYQIKNKIKNTEQYENMLVKVNRKINKAIMGYGNKLQQGQQGIQQLMSSLGKACNQIQNNRKYLSVCVEKVSKSYFKVGPTLRKINNIKKVIEILSVWGQYKIPYLFSIDLAHPSRYQLPIVLQLFQKAKQKLQNNPSLPQSASLQKILSSLTQKNRSLITNICMQFTSSIISFTTSQQYKIKYQQYLTIRNLFLCNDLFTLDGIKQIIATNSKTMYYTILSKYTINNNVDLLNQNMYLEFYDQIIEEFVIYFRSWHYVTTFHLDNSTPYGYLFLETRKLVFITLSDQITQSIQNSKKFISLEYKIKLQLVEKLQDYMEAGQKWMGTYQNIELPKIVTAKLNAQLTNIFSLYNNLIKNILAQQITVSALQSVDQVRPLHPAKITVTVAGVDYTKVSQFLCANSTIKAHSQGVQKIYQSLPAPPQVRMKIGQVFAEMIGEYLQRSKYLQLNKSIFLIKIFQHFQFIIFMMYQICIRQSLKQKLTTNIRSSLSSNQTQVSQQTSAISLKQLNQLCKINIFQKKYMLVNQFLIVCGNKYDGIKVAGIIDVNKLYESGSSDLINGYVKIIIRVIGDLKRILDWLIDVLPKTPMKGYRQCTKIAKFSDIIKQIFGLVLQNNLQYITKKYLQTLPPLISKLKWQVKKFNQQTASLYKQYKIKILQIFRNNTLITLIKAQAPQLAYIVVDRQVESLYRNLLECYGRIQKINDNGRQLIRLDCIQITKILHQIGINCQTWSNWFDRYLDLTAQRSYKTVLQKMQKIGIMYEFISWKYSLLWITNDLSSKEKKQYNAGLAIIYMQYLGK